MTLFKNNITTEFPVIYNSAGLQPTLNWSMSLKEQLNNFSCFFMFSKVFRKGQFRTPLIGEAPMQYSFLGWTCQSEFGTTRKIEDKVDCDHPPTSLDSAVDKQITNIVCTLPNLITKQPQIYNSTAKKEPLCLYESNTLHSYSYYKNTTVKNKFKIYFCLLPLWMHF